MIELKNGDSVHGIFENIDDYMNVKLTNFLHTSNNGEKFIKIPVGYVRGNNINSFQFKSDILDKIEEEKLKNESNIPRKNKYH